MKKYKHLFFDLDHTLWDFEINSRETLYEIYQKFGLGSMGIRTAEIFVKVYKEHNKWMWTSFGRGEIAKEQLRVKRFELTLAHFGVNPRIISEELAESYLRISPTKNNLIPEAKGLLDYLVGRYEMHIITNGFPEVQWIKLRNSGLENYFQSVFISEEIGHKKPQAGIFDFALKSCDASKEDSLMIGDSLEADIIGAKNSGIDQVFFNPEGLIHKEKATFEIQTLSELMSIL